MSQFMNTCIHLYISLHSTGIYKVFDVHLKNIYGIYICQHFLYPVSKLKSIRPLSRCEAIKVVHKLLMGVCISAPQIHMVMNKSYDIHFTKWLNHHLRCSFIMFLIYILWRLMYKNLNFFEPGCREADVASMHENICSPSYTWPCKIPSLI